MKTTRITIAIAAVAAVLTAGPAAVPAGANPSPPPPLLTTSLASGPISPTVLLGHGKTTADAPWGILMLTRGITDGYVVDNKFDPGASTGWHSHPGPSLIFVVSGTVTDYDSSVNHCAGVSYSAGSTLTDSGGTDVHMLRNDGTAPAETIAVQFIPSGQPRKTPEPEPANCRA